MLSSIDIGGFGSAHDAFSTYYRRPLADIVLQASSFKPQVFTHVSPCCFALPLFLAGVRSVNVANLQPSECVSCFSHSAATRPTIRAWYCPFSSDNLRFCSRICSLCIWNFHRSLSSTSLLRLTEFPSQF